MALPSFFKRKKTEDEAPPSPVAASRAGRRGAANPLPEAATSRTQAPHESAAVTQARIHARRRLIGAAVLLLLGVLLFPLVFETQPRPLRMDLPMVVAPDKAGGAPGAASVSGSLGSSVAVPPPAVAAATATAATTATPTPGAAPAPTVRPAPPMITETAEPEPQAAAQTGAQPATPAPRAASTPAASKTAPPAARPASAPAKAASKPAATAAAAAAPASQDASARFVVQVGAFADDATVRQTRQKVEKLGLKTYTQEVNTDAGKRVRVRVGPFATRDEASQVLNKLRVRACRAPC